MSLLNRFQCNSGIWHDGTNFDRDDNSNDWQATVNKKYKKNILGPKASVGMSLKIRTFTLHSLEMNSLVVHDGTVHDVGMCSVGVHTAVVHWSELACSEHAWHDHA
jgi:hypothetical protein